MSLPEDVILAPAERYLHLSSEYATEAQGGSSDCRFRVNSVVTAGNEQYCMAVGVHNATIPHTWYNIFGTKWTIHFGYGGITTLTGTIPMRNYTAAALASAFETSVNDALVAAGAAATFTVTYDADTNYMLFSNSVVALVSPWYFVATENSCYLELGLRYLAQGRTSAVVSALNAGSTAYVLQPLAMVDLSAFHGIYINLQSHVSNAQASYNGLNQTSILARVPVRNPFGAVETFEPQNIEYVYLPNAALSDIQVVLTGDDGQLLNLHGVDWTITLHVKFMSIRQPVAPRESMLPADSLMTTQLFGGRRVY